jgi:Helix-turn-helix domain
VIDIGASLAAARRARGLDLRGAEELTCMRARYLTALEEERFDDLPGHTYARAFLRTYANALGLQAEHFVSAFDEQVPEPADELPPPPRRRRSAHVSWRLAPLAAGAAVFALLVWSAWSNDHGQRSAAPPKPPPPSAVSQARHGVRAAVKTFVSPAPAAVVVRATAGACWVQARRGGATGPVLAEQTLQPGQTLRLRGPHVWLRLGAPWNAVVRRGARIERLPATGAPVNVLL